MSKRCALMLAFILTPASAAALEIKNFRPCYAPVPFGASRTEKDLKCLPGDFIWVTYDIEGLKLDPKTGKASFVTIFELFDSQAKPVFDPKRTPNEFLPQLGGTRMPGDLHLQMGRNQKPGKYVIRLTVQDRNSNESKSQTQQFELLQRGFGFAGVVAPGIGFAGQHYATEFALIDMGLDAKKQPDVKVEMRVLDENAKPVATSTYWTLPRDLPMGTDLVKENLVPLHFPLYLNRPGRFIIDILAKDNVSKTEARLTYPLTVVDFVTGK
jgi:hypothetical protein